ncbi:MAG: methyltransferase, TrmH family, group 3 [Nitrospirae bacterium]|jgi:TrmH family RNA methyltransferase|nr:methyltransferase, TrmH family, group 3 [Nitrospirota bacterium]
MERTSPHNPVTSKENKAVKFLASLADPKVRKKEKAFLIEGVKMVEEALRDRLGVKQVIANPSLTQHHGKGVIKLAEKNGIEILWISERLMDHVAEGKTPQPVMAVVEMREHTEEELLAHRSGLIVMAHQLQDPGNLGTIMRTAEAVGASGVAITPHTVDAYNGKAVRGSMGSILRVPVVKVRSEHEFMRACKERGFQTAALVLNGRETPYDLDLTVPTVIMLGQESSGLMAEELVDVDHRVRIPMVETIDSLNVAVSAAVLLYEAYRQRMNK